MALKFNARTSTIELDSTSTLTLPASTTSAASLNIAEAVAAPSAPVDGDVWVTAGGAFNARLNGATVDLSATGGDVSAAGTPVNNQIGVWTSAFTIEGDANLTWTGSTLTLAGAGAQLLLPSESDAVTPTLAFGDGDAGFYEVGDDVIGVALGGAAIFYFQSSSSYFTGSSSQSFYVRNTGATSTVPTLGPRRDFNTGLGQGAADQLSLIAGGVEIMRLVGDTTDYVHFNTPLMIAERAAAITNQTGFGQLWAGTDNSLNFTDEAGTNTILTAGGSGTVTSSTGADNRIAVFTTGTNIEGDANFTWDGTDLSLNAGTNSVNATELGLLEGLTTLSGSNTGDQTITLTGDVTGSGTGSFAATIAADSVTMDKIVDIATDTFLGRVTAATGTVEVLTNAQAKTALDLTGTNSGDQTITLTGDVTGTGTGSFAATIANSAVTNAKMADMAANTVKVRTVSTGAPQDLAISANTVLGAQGAGLVSAQVATGQIANDAVTYAKMQNVVANNVFLGNNAGAGGIVDELTGTEATAMLDTFATASTVQGVVPGSNSLGATYYLDGSGAWSVPAGGSLSGSADETITGTWRHEVDNAATAALVTTLEVSATSTGTPAAGFGPAIDFYAETAAGSPGNQELVGKIGVEMTSVTGAAETGELVFYTMDLGGAAEQRWAMTGTAGGEGQLIGPNAISLYAGANEVISGGSQTEIFYSGTRRFRTAVGGDVDLFSDGNTSTEGRAINFNYQNGTTTAELGFRATSNFDIHNNINSGHVRITADDAGDVARTILEGDPDATTTLRADTNLQLQVAAGEAAITCTANGGVNMYYDNVLHFRVNDNNNLLTDVSGADVVDRDGNLLPVGFNILYDNGGNANQTLSSSDVGHALFKTNTTAYSYTLPSGGNYAVGGTTQLFNANTTADITINATTNTQTLYWLDGSTRTGGASTNRTIGPGGVVTIFYFGSNIWYMWGSGIS